MTAVHQQIASANLLALVRGKEAFFQLHTGLDRTLAQALYGSPHRPIGTQARKHRVTDRAARKLRAKWIGVARFYNPDLFWSGRYQLAV